MTMLNILKSCKPQLLLSCAIGFAGLLSSCGSQTDSELKIYGGTKTEAGDWASTVALTNNGSMFCSGTIVHPRLVITAAHCVANIRGTRSLGVYLGEGREGGRVSNTLRVESFASSPRYSQSRNGWNDIAYLVMEEEIEIAEEDIPQILLDETEMEELIRVGATSKLVGFGVRDDRGFGVKYEVDAPITRFNDNEVYIGRNGKDSCQGDSGGPAYGQLEDGSWGVYGVVSRGGRCGTGGIWGRMSANICWVEDDSGIDLELGDFCEQE